MDDSALWPLRWIDDNDPDDYFSRLVDIELGGARIRIRKYDYEATYRYWDTRMDHEDCKRYSLLELRALLREIAAGRA